MYVPVPDPLSVILPDGLNATAAFGEPEMFKLSAFPAQILVADTAVSVAVGMALTVSFRMLEHPPGSAYVIVVDPVAIADNVPVTELIPATDVLPLDHDPPAEHVNV